MEEAHALPRAAVQGRQRRPNTDTPRNHARGAACIRAVSARTLPGFDARRAKPFEQLALTVCTTRREDPASKIGEKLRRVFIEKGHGFFDKYVAGTLLDKVEVVEEKQKDADDSVQPMTPEELFKMRMEVLPQLQ